MELFYKNDNKQQFFLKLATGTSIIICFFHITSAFALNLIEKNPSIFNLPFLVSNPLPLAYTSSNSGATWTLSSALSLPSGQTQAELFDLSCVVNNCITVGASCSTNFSNLLPVIYASSNTGSSWTLSSALTLPSGQSEGVLISTTCSGTACIATGASFNGAIGNVTNILPLVYTSSDNGSTWALSSALSLPSGQSEGILLSTFCTGSACNAVGASFNGTSANPTNILPLSYTSSNGGATWALSPSLALPSGQTQGVIRGVYCTIFLCTAVGTSLSSSNNRLPLAYTSSDGGATWTLSSALSLPSGQTQGVNIDLYCTTLLCTAVGTSLNSSTSNLLPMVYTSISGGATWTLSSALSLPSGQTQGMLNGINCVATACTAIGTSLDSTANNMLPLLYTSSNGGITWTLSSAFSLPSGQTQGRLLGASCSGTNCAAIGFSMS